MGKFSLTFVQLQCQKILMSDTHQKFLKLKLLQQWQASISRIQSYTKRSMAELTCSSNKLCIQSGRHQNIDRHERICPYCQEQYSGSIIPEAHHWHCRCLSGLNLMDALQDWFQNNPSDRDIELIKLSTRELLNGQTLVHCWLQIHCRSKWIHTDLLWDRDRLT